MSDAYGVGLDTGFGFSPNGIKIGLFGSSRKKKKRLVATPRVKKYNLHNDSGLLMMAQMLLPKKIETAAVNTYGPHTRT